jgi:hypothetical protein
MIGSDFYIERADGTMWLGTTHKDDTKNWLKPGIVGLPIGLGKGEAGRKIENFPEYFKDCTVVSQETTR